VELQRLALLCGGFLGCRWCVGQGSAGGDVLQAAVFHSRVILADPRGDATREHHPCGTEAMRRGPARKQRTGQRSWPCTTSWGTAGKGAAAVKEGQG